jgi:MHS family proline/betaine transporter-like MFS transporter
VGLYIRRSTEESEEFLTSVKTHNPIMAVVRNYPIELICTMFLTSATTVLLYFAMYLPSYAVARLGMQLGSSLAITVASGFVLCLLPPIGGLFADRIGRVRMIIFGVIIMIPTPWILLNWLAANPDSLHLFLCQFAICVMMSIYGPAQVSITATIFPVAVRASGASLSSALSGSLFGGFALFGFAALGALFHHPAAPSLYVVGTSSFALIAILTLRRRHGTLLLDSSN